MATAIDLATEQESAYMDPEQQEQAAFEQSLYGTAPEITSTPAEAVAEVQTPEPEAVEVEAAPAEASEPAAEAQAEAKPEDDDPVLLDGLKRSELHRLLSNAADVDNLRKQLDKAHGNIGNLNRQLQQALQTLQAGGKPGADTAEKIKRFEEDYPDVAEYMRALGVQPQTTPQDPPLADNQPPEATGQGESQAGIDPLAIEIAVMDHAHKGWREKVSSPEFNVWLAAQGIGVQQAYHSAQTADALVAVIGQYDQWTTARQAATQKAAKSQQRLQAAMTPAGNAPIPVGAMTEEQAFEAALRS